MVTTKKSGKRPISDPTRSEMAGNQGMADTIETSPASAFSGISLMTNVLSVGVIVWNEKGHCLHCNASAQLLLNPSDAPGATKAEAVFGESAWRTINQTLVDLMPGQAIHLTTGEELQNRDQRLRVLLFPVALEAGSGLTLAVIEDPDDNRPSWWSSMSHEIRGRMTVINGMLSLLKSTPLSDAQGSYVDKALTASDNLLNTLGVTSHLSGQGCPERSHPGSLPPAPESMAAPSEPALLSKVVAAITARQYIAPSDQVALIGQLTLTNGPDFALQVQQALDCFDYAEAVRLLKEVGQDGHENPGGRQ